MCDIGSQKTVQPCGEVANTKCAFQQQGCGCGCNHHGGPMCPLPQSPGCWVSPGTPNKLLFCPRAHKAPSVSASWVPPLCCNQHQAEQSPACPASLGGGTKSRSIPIQLPSRPLGQGDSARGLGDITELPHQPGRGPLQLACTFWGQFSPFFPSFLGQLPLSVLQPVPTSRV